MKFCCVTFHSTFYCKFIEVGNTYDSVQQYYTFTNRIDLITQIDTDWKIIFDLKNCVSLLFQKLLI